MLGAAVLHVLAILFTVWNVSFNAIANYSQVLKLADAEYIQASGVAHAQHQCVTQEAAAVHSARSTQHMQTTVAAACCRSCLKEAVHAFHTQHQAICHPLVA